MLRCFQCNAAVIGASNGSAVRAQQYAGGTQNADQHKQCEGGNTHRVPDRLQHDGVVQHKLQQQLVDFICVLIVLLGHCYSKRGERGKD